VFGAFSWAPSGARLVYAANGLVGGDLYTVEADGTGLTRLTSGGGNHSPVWSPEGNRIAFVHVVRVRLPSRLFRLDEDIWLMSADGRNPRRLTRDGADKRAPQWSPDGTRILFSGAGTSILDADDGRVLVHTADAGGSWSPDGMQVAVQSGSGVDVIRSDGTSRRPIAAAGAEDPHWSTDGRLIAFTRSHCTPGIKGLCGIRLSSVYTVGADGHGERRLTGPISGGPGARMDGFPNDGSFGPAWWPGDSQLFFTRSFRAYAMNADGTCEHPFGPANRHLTAPAWRPGSTPAAASLRCVDLRTRAIPARNPVGLRGAGRVHVTVENDGSETATFATLTLKLVYGRGRIRAPLPSCRDAAAVVCDLAPLRAGASRTLTVDVSDRTIAGFQLEATVTARGADSEPRTTASVAFVQVLDCDLVGTERPDRLVGTAGQDRICGLPGGDVIHAGAGNDTIRGGAGADTIVPGPGRDVVWGGEGRDRIFARDGNRDEIECGPYRDVVYADRSDKLRNCELVVF
jgi:hypothetical protein